jgi:hypothetical protein
VRRGEFDPAAVHDFTGRILRHTRAALADALALPTEQRSAMVEATIGIEAATAFVILGDLANARDTLAAVLELPENMRTFPVVYRLKSLHEQLGHAQQTQQAQALDAQLTAFMDASTVRALPAGG